MFFIGYGVGKYKRQYTRGGTKTNNNVNTENYSNADEIRESNKMTASVNILPGHNTYFNGFERKTNLRYDDVASVTDLNYTFAIGTYYDEDYYQEKAESFSHLGDGWLVNGCFCTCYYYNYKDINLTETTYNPIIRDYSGEKLYLGNIILTSPRFSTKKGIHVGSPIDEIFKAYDTDGYNNIDSTCYESDGETYYRLLVDGIEMDFFFDNDTDEITRIEIGYW